MVFSSPSFLFVFLPILVVIYLFCAKKQKHTHLLLVVASLLFYAQWNPYYLLLLLASIGSNYVGNAKLRRSKKKNHLVLLILVNLIPLFLYKYFGFGTEVLNQLLEMGLPIWEPVLPLGISFFTFQQITYQIDTYKGIGEKSSFLDYTLFVTFFPQLIAGPIVHHQEMMPQFNKETPYSFIERLPVAGMLFSMGLAKKLLLADTLAIYCDPVFDASLSGQSLTLLEAWAGLFTYTFQLYFDFSGYCDMAAALAWIFGIRLPINFLSPYKAKDIINFWRRWHITLSRFLRDYLYIPLGGNRKGHYRRYMNLLTTMLIGGLWHGAGWNFLIWGALHGFYLVANHLWKNLKTPLPTLFSIPLTFLSVSFAWVFFRTETLDSAIQFTRSLLGFNGISADPRLASLLSWVPNIQFNTHQLGSFHLWGIPILLLAFLVAFALPNTVDLFKENTPFLSLDSYKTLNKKAPTFSLSYLWISLFSLLIFLCLLMLLSVQKTAFLYYDF